MNIEYINFYNDDEFIVPTYATDGSSGLDLRSFSKEDIILKPNQRVLVATGLAIAMPLGVEAQIRSRSGLAIKNGVIVLNSPGTIDSDYRGEIKVILINLGQDDFIVKYQDKIAQIVFSNIIKTDFIKKDVLSTTIRQNGGFGSTGI